MAVSDRVRCAERVWRIEQDDFSRHLVLNALVDIQTNRRGLIILNDSLFDADGCVTMLLYALKRCSKCLVPERKLLFVVVDPVIRTRTQKRMLSFEMRMLSEAQRAPPSR